MNQPRPNVRNGPNSSAKADIAGGQRGARRGFVSLQPNGTEIGRPLARDLTFHSIATARRIKLAIDRLFAKSGQRAVLNSRFAREKLGCQVAAFWLGGVAMTLILLFLELLGRPVAPPLAFGHVRLVLLFDRIEFALRIGRGKSAQEETSRGLFAVCGKKPVAIGA